MVRQFRREARSGLHRISEEVAAQALGPVLSGCRLHFTNPGGLRLLDA